MEVLWSRTVGVLLENAADDLGGMWSLVRAGQRAALCLAVDPELDRQLNYTFAALELSEALEDLEWAHPELTTTSATADLGEVPDGAVADAHQALDNLLKSIVSTAARILRQHDEVLETGDVLCLARVAHQVSAAHALLVPDPS